VSGGFGQRGLKTNDNFWTTHFITLWSGRIGLALARRRVSPNVVTAVSFVLGLLAALLFAVAGRWGALAGAVMLQCSFAADCIDGQIARLNGTGTKAGMMLDWWSDRVKDVAVTWGLVVGASADGSGAWRWGVLLLALITVRAHVTQSFEFHRSDRPPNTSEATAKLSGARHWLSSVLMHPYGDRVGLTSIGVAVGGASVGMQVLVGAGLLALFLQLAGRLRRRELGLVEAAETGLRRDGPVAGFLRPRVGRLPSIVSLSLLLAGTVFLLLSISPSWIAFGCIVGALIAVVPVGPSSAWVSSFHPVLLVSTALVAGVTADPSRGPVWLAFASLLYVGAGVGIAQWRFHGQSRGSFSGWETLVLLMAVAVHAGQSWWILSLVAIGFVGWLLPRTSGGRGHPHEVLQR